MSDGQMVSRAEIDRASGKGVRVLVVDSGVEKNHPDLKGRDVPCYKLETRGGSTHVVRDAGGGDTFGHGTAVAAIIGEHAPDCTIDSVQVLGGDLRGSSSRIVAALNWAINEKYDIINCSFGTASPEYIGRYKEIVDLAFCRNVWFISACNNFDFRTLEYPGSFPTVLSTDYAAMDDPLAIKRRRGHLVEFVARGAQITVAWKNGTQRKVHGSSFAAPHLAAVAARIRELHAEWNACEVKTALYQLAEG